MFEQSEKDNAELIRNAGASHPAAGSNARKIADCDAAWMDTATIEKHGLRAIKPELTQTGAINSREDLARVLGNRLRAVVDQLDATNYHTSNLFGLLVTQGLEGPSQPVAYPLQGGIELPSRGYYLSTDTHLVEARDNYLTYVGALLTQAGIADAQAKAKTIVALQAKSPRCRPACSTAKTCTKPTIFGPWPRSVPQHRAWIGRPTSRPPVCRTRLRLTPGSAEQSPACPRDCQRAIPAWKDLTRLAQHQSCGQFAAQGVRRSPLQFLRPRSAGHTRAATARQACRRCTGTEPGDALGQLYVKHYFPASSKAAIEQLVKNLIAAFSDRIATLP